LSELKGVEFECRFLKVKIKVFLPRYNLVECAFMNLAKFRKLYSTSAYWSDLRLSKKV
jgi:hypothetical protein